jgi:hypothetical protein
VASILEEVRDFFITCSALDSTKLLNVNKILSNPVNYSIDTVTSPLIVYEDITGQKLRNFRFYLTISAQCDTLEKQFAVQELLESLVSWIETQEDDDNYPTSTGNKLEILQTPELFTKDESLTQGIYQILVNYEYYD